MTLPCRNLHFLERLLADGASLEGVWPQTGETPLLIAISWKDVEVGGSCWGLVQPYTHTL
jgi:hypothetical protein